MCRQCFRQYADDIGFKKVQPLLLMICAILIAEHSLTELELRHISAVGELKMGKTLINWSSFVISWLRT